MELWRLYVNSIPIIFGALIGSFLNVVIIRWPAEQSIIRPRSACPTCRNPIAWYDNIPVLSFLILRAKCRHCAQPISWRYPLVEILTAFMSFVTFRRFVPDITRMQGAQLGAYLLYFALVAGLIAITFIDLEHYLIPDEISLPAVPIGILGMWALEGTRCGMTTVWGAILGAAMGAGILWSVRALYYLVRRQEGMGMGDVKMMAMLGAFLGPHPALIFIIFVSSFLGSIVGLAMMLFRRKSLQYQVPFGPFLALGGLLYLFGGYQLAPRFIPVGVPLEVLFAVLKELATRWMPW